MPIALALLAGWLTVVLVALVVAIAFCRMAKDNLPELREIYSRLSLERAGRVPAERSELLRGAEGDRAPGGGGWPR
jgi:hypothetical protein